MIKEFKTLIKEVEKNTGDYTCLAGLVNEKDESLMGLCFSGTPNGCLALITTFVVALADKMECNSVDVAKEVLRVIKEQHEDDEKFNKMMP